MDLKKLIARLLKLGVLTTLLFSHYQLSVTHSQSPNLPVDNLGAITTIPINTIAERMTLSPDGTRLYVSQPPSPTNPDTSHHGSIAVIDTSTNTVIDTISLGFGFPLTIMITPDGSRAYVVISKAVGQTITSGANRVEVIDTATNTIIETILMGNQTPYGTSFAVMTADGSKIYVTDRAVNQVDVIDTASNTISDTIPVGDRPVDLAITPDNSRVYVVRPSDETTDVAVDVIDTNSHSVIATIPLSFESTGSWDPIAITPNGNVAYITDNSGDIAILDTNPNSPTYHQEIGLISTTGNLLRYIAITPDGNYAFVVSAGPKEMLIIDTNSDSPNYHTQIGAVGVGDGAWDIILQDLPVAIAYVSNRLDGNISVIGIQDPLMPTAGDVSETNTNTSSIIIALLIILILSMGGVLATLKHSYST